MASQVGIRIKTRMSAEQIEKLLSKVCQNKPTFSFDGIEEKDGIQYKVVLIDFANENDRNAFRAALAKK
jgi:hypothetical protein